ncbi:serine O-acetyltransferase [Methanosarcina sp.]|uniref:serine O-acetyltransferase n=1 Tax=Methanosarcina sp. TaxID=2213 RepID=UPI00298974F1|nr:serine O-acetyltransferase [Methanosarcina sp.]MDW5549862.1 serine O-acetyltransferase [Methanosarcina sp.]MDW5552465.1 serine O-acetyltransferase [Methanosarcina sp.]MDW5560196.1 serine O-acetyltransferase [Methanosarcina sp.]
MGIREDIRTVFKKDPAARSTFEVICCYPGLHAIWVHRISHSLWNRHFYFLARLLSHISRMLTGIEIHPGAKLGRQVFIDHGSGVVIGETAEVGDDVLIYMGVVLGGTALEKVKRHPTIENDVVIGSGASVLGPITIGRWAKIGAGSVVIRPVPAGATVVGVPARIAEPYPPISAGQLDHDKLPDPGLVVMSQMLDRLSRLEDQFQAHEELVSGHGKTPQGTVSKDEQIYSLLKDVVDPEVGMDIVKLGLVKEIVVDGLNVDVNLVLTTSACPMIEYLKDQIRRKVLSAGGIEKVNVNILDEPWKGDLFKKQIAN